MASTQDSFVESLRNSPAVRLLADAYPCFLSYVDTNYRYQFCNRAYTEHFGVAAEKVVGHSVVSVWGEVPFASIQPKLDMAFRGELVTYESAIGGVHRTASYIPHCDADGRVHGVLVFVQDTTELQTLRTALVQAERMASLGRLVAGLLHELNTPLGAMSANAQTVKRSAERARDWVATEGDDQERALQRAKRALEVIVDSSDTMAAAVTRLSGFVDSMRRFAAVDEGEEKECSLPQVLDDAVALLEHRIGEGVSVERRYDAEVPPLRCRPAGINQVVMTLLSNAVDALDGAGRIDIVCRSSDEAVEIEVRDDGRGIEAERLDFIFEPTFSAGERSRASFSLYVGRTIVEAHSGTIGVESELGRGSCFRVRLPRST